MTTAADALPDNIGALRALILAERAEREQLAQRCAQLAERNAILERLTTKLEHAGRGTRSRRIRLGGDIDIAVETVRSRSRRHGKQSHSAQTGLARQDLQSSSVMARALEPRASLAVVVDRGRAEG